MYFIRGLKNLPNSLRGGVVTIGNFDGVHLGHRALLKSLKVSADRQHLPAIAVTFEPHPRILLRPGNHPKRITTVRSKVRLLKESGVDGMLTMRFTHHLAGLTPEDFVQTVLVDGLTVREVLVGYNFRFGRGGAGTMETLRRLGEQHGFKAECYPAYRAHGETVSSTRVRACVQSADFKTAAALLGRLFEVEGRVGAGRKRGRTLGFPTANIALTGHLHPPSGVYVTSVCIDNAWLPAISNVGINPTFGDEGLHLETHLLVSCGDLYRQLLRVRFLHRLREEITFSNQEALRQQIVRDVQQARKFHAQVSQNPSEL